MKSTRDVVECEKPEVILVKLKRHRELTMNLMHDVKKLQENWSEPRVLVWIGQVASMVESVPKSKPFLFNQNPESFDRSVVRV